MFEDFLRLKILWIVALAFLSGCGGEDESASESTCAALTGSSWVPSVSGMASTNHDSGVTVSKEVLTGSGLLTGLGQAATNDREIEVSFTVDDLGTNGSITLVGQTTDFPGDLSGGAYPLLVSLYDGTNELINLSRTGSGGDCADSGYYTCVSGSCSVNSSCSIGSPSAYEDRTHYDYHQTGGFDYVSTNVFPTCNWSEGSPSCAFNSTFFVDGKLKTGTYRARYILLAGSYSSVTGYTAGLKVTVSKKSDSSAVAEADNGAIDLNVILVGSENVSDSRTAKGQENLNALFTHVYNHYSQSGTGIKIGAINVIEWGCEAGGDSYADVELTSLSTLFSTGSALVSSETEGRALNIFLVSTIPYSSSTVLGAAGAIGGPTVNGTGASGLAFASFDKLDTFNPNCGSECSSSEQEAAFIDMGSTISHEIGHYLGLNHLSERTGSTHDYIADTPTCSGSGGSVSHNSCLQEEDCSAVCSDYDRSGTFCPNESACQFNHVMWWTSKNVLDGGSGDGNLFSTNSSSVMNYSSFVY